MRFKLISLLLIFPIFSIAQYTIQGKILDAETKKPLEGISVILSNTTKGTVTNNKGEFELENVKIGKYELVATSVNYEEYIMPVVVNQRAEPIVINLKPAVNILKEVVVEPYDENGWDKWGDIFKSSFIGSTQLAKSCILINPEVIKFKYVNNTNKLKVFSNEKLIFENKALGYRIIYLLSKFEFDFNNNTFSFKGHPLFEELKPKSAKEIAKWNQMRSDTYKGSLRHFIRSLYFNQLSEDRFEIRKVRFVAPDEVHRVKRILVNLHDKENKGSIDNIKVDKDSMDYYLKVKGLGIDENKVVLSNIISRDSIVVNSNEPNSKAVYFNDYLQVSFLKKRVAVEFAKTLPSYRSNDFIQSDISLRFNNPILIYPNGSYYDGLGLLIEGYWAWSEKISTMLPSDYSLGK